MVRYGNTAHCTCIQKVYLLLLQHSKLLQIKAKHITTLHCLCGAGLGPHSQLALPQGPLRNSRPGGDCVSFEAWLGTGPLPGLLHMPG
jgi:hypothetical protein